MRLLRLPGMMLSALAEMSVTNVPGPLGRALRYRYWRGRVKSMGRGVKIDVGVRILNPEWVTIGDNTWIDSFVILLAGPAKRGDGPFYCKGNPDFPHGEGELIIGRNVHIANFVVIQGHGGVKIGDNITTASGSKIYSLSHHHSNLVDRTDTKAYKFTSMADRADQSLISAPVVMGDDSALGLNGIVLPGVTIGAGSWVGAGALVSQSVPPNTLVSGNPATVVKAQLHATPETGIAADG